MTSVYTLRNINHSYEARSVLCLPELAIQQGEVLAIVGPSGAGKSTLLRLLGFLENPTEGHIAVHTAQGAMTYQNITIAERRKIAMVFQHSLMLSRNVRTNVAYGLNVRGQRRQHARVDEMLEKVALNHLANANPRKLSGGELQRVAIARALVIEPQILLLDEPTANLDPYNIKVIEDCLMEQHQQHNSTLVIVTHNIFQARRLADRVALMLEGQLVEVSPTKNFFEDPTDPRTAKFLVGDIIY